MTGCIELFHTRSWKGAVAVVGVAALVTCERERERDGACAHNVWI